MQNRSIVIGMLLLCMVLSFSVSAHAFSTLVAYGDSLSDDGDDGAWPFPSGLARLTDQKVWVEILADRLGSQLYSVSYAGATTGIDNPQATESNPAYDGKLGLQWQLGAYQPYFNAHLDMSDTVFTIWAGANDFIAGRGHEQAVNNVGTAVRTLIEGGAQHVLVANMPDLGNTPLFYDDNAFPGSTAAASGWSIAYNNALLDELALIQQDNMDLNLYQADMHRLFLEDLLEFDATGKIINHDELFWDDIHPTMIGHSAIAGEAYNSIVPVPTSLILLGAGLLGLGVIRRRLI